MLPSLNARLRKANLPIPLSLPLLGVLSVIILLLLLIIGWQVRPFVLWAYNVEKAGALQATALRYPEPRQSDSFPTENDAAANNAALGHLAAAIHWRPTDPYAYRLAGHSYMAQGDWLNAINVLENGATRADDDILLSWELALAYEKIYEQAENAPYTDLVPRFAAADPDAPTLRVETPYCKSGDVRSCYVGIGTFTHPYAVFPNDAPLTADALFIHPPARLTIPLDLPQGDPALSFMMGLDPFAQEWGTDGATFQFWVIQADGGILPVYERTIIGGELRQGWVLDSIDLRAWAGQSIQLAVGTDDGPLDDNSGDWVGLGNLILTDGQSATYRNLMPQQRFRTAIKTGQISDSQLVGRGDESIFAGDYEDAELWYRRAEWAGVDTTSSVAYADFLELRDKEDFETALPYLQDAINADRGWGSAFNRFTAFLTYGRWLIEEERYVESQAYLNVAVAMYPDPAPANYGVVAEAQRYLALSYSELGEPEAGLPFARRAVEMNANDFNNQYVYGRLIYEADPTRVDEIEQAFSTALTLSAAPENWQSVIGVWLQGGDTSRAEGYCQTALTFYALAQLDYVCWDAATTDASQIHLDAYYRLYNEDQAAAYAQLESAITVNGGWQNKEQRFEAWQTWAMYLFMNEQYEATIAAGKTAIGYQTEGASNETLTMLDAQIAISYSRLNNYQEALPYFEAALELLPIASTSYEYGIALYGADPTTGLAQVAFDEALELSDNSPLMRSLIIDFWYSKGVTAEATALCAATARPSRTEQTLCVPSGIALSSGTLFQQYLDAKSANAPDAQSYLEQATALDIGWQRLTFRHRAWFDLGTSLWEQKSYDEALAALETALEASDSRVSAAMESEVHRFIGLTYWEQGSLDEAITAFEEAIRLDPSNTFAYIHQGQVYYQQAPEMPERVRAAFEQAIATSPADSRVWEAILDFWIFQEQGQEIAALCLLADDTLKSNLGARCWDGVGQPSPYNYAIFVENVDSDSATAYFALQAAILTDSGWQNDEERYNAWYAWGAYQWQYGNGAVAAEAFAVAVSIIPPTLPDPARAELHRLYAATLNATQQGDAALAQINEALAIEPNNAAIYVTYGEIRYATESAPDVGANEAFSEAVRLAPDTVEIWQSIVRFWLNEGNADQVLAWCGDTPNTLLPLVEPICWDGSTTPSIESMRLYAAATATNDSEAAAVALEAAVISDMGWRDGAQQYEGWREWGKWLFQQSRWDESGIVLTRALELAPDTTSAAEIVELQQLQAEILFIQGEGDASVALLESLLDENSDNFWLYVQYGKTLYRADSTQQAEAIDLLNEILDAQPDNSVLWNNIAYFWVEQDERDGIDALCARANSTIAPLIALYCWDGEGASSHTSYLAYIADIEAGEAADGLVELEAAILQNGGWVNESERFEAWGAWGQYLWRTAQHEDAILSLQQAIDYAPESANAFVLADIYHSMGLALAATEQMSAALAALSTATTIFPEHAWAQLNYGMLLHDVAPAANLEAAKERFAMALSLAPNDALLWQTAIGHWQLYGSAEATALCQEALTLPIANDVATLCGSP